eukprot:350556-Chlamydomonas_euryale.AAC.22
MHAPPAAAIRAAGRACPSALLPRMPVCAPSAHARLRSLGFIAFCLIPSLRDPLIFNRILVSPGSVCRQLHSH